ncbi:uncharacterized protein LOC129590459 [Paramacrobiotus metropolitanus]|uniref:uncharacterized protein LOC129590459 n=1 Tax=Paramacrobiotus metropolitanus TaxID=2943436 RepID=UPI002445A0B2|nr:uncharacterized protein LOC129590459 [Paramacrobiotus metropolitanus]XP_055341676.1 uncharacterized protein LOC129590459 [Paramacrobiotus metropolitanus]XP_055341677.1 uncharacterized protein LOC129590459 [Paramacrobiotus metropolitanus]
MASRMSPVAESEFDILDDASDEELAASRLASSTASADGFLMEDVEGYSRVVKPLTSVALPAVEISSVQVDASTPAPQPPGPSKLAAANTQPATSNQPVVPFINTQPPPAADHPIIPVVNTQLCATDPSKLPVVIGVPDLSSHSPILTITDKNELLDILRTRAVLILGEIPPGFLKDIEKVADVYVLHSSEQARHRNPEEFNNALGIFLSLMEDAEKSQWFVFVDPSLVGYPLDPGPEDTVIQYYRNGQLVTGDLVRNVPDENAVCAVAKAVIAPVKADKPQKRGSVVLPCPGANKKSCQMMKKTFEWKCGNCNQVLEYGFDDNFYCACGKAPAEAFVFQCGSPKHGWEYVGFEPADLRWVLKEIQPFEEVNILVLGETGVGKSTWINGFANFLTYAHLEDALADPIFLIPSRFTMTDKSLEEKVVCMGGANANEPETGQSDTQMPASYAIKKGSTVVRLIDTPGIGDTRGADQDKKNFQLIMQHLANYEKIHGICILLKPNDSRLTVMFRFCIKELLTHLHRDCCHNIVFIFTNARSTFYRPGNTFPILKKLLKDSQGVDIALNEDTIYCVDSEAVRFMAALKAGIQFNDTETQNFFNSWEKSVEETERLLKFVASRTPHILQNTISLNEARRMILSFTEPLAHITKNIQINLQLAEEKAEEIREREYSKRQLSQQLYVPVIDLESVPLGFPRTVCVSQKCIRVVGQKVDYVTWCHDHCYLKGIQQEQYPNPGLKQCDAMMPSGEKCNHCACSWEKHMHISYEMREVEVKEVDERVQKLLRQKDGEIVAVGVFLDEVEQRKLALHREEKEIRLVAAKFGCFLKRNAMIPYNDAMEEYLNYLISNEKEKIAVGLPRDHLVGYERMLREYREEKQLLEESMQSGEKEHQLTMENIVEAIQSLYGLPINGRRIRSFVEMMQDVRKQQTQHNEMFYSPKISRVRIKKYRDEDMYGRRRVSLAPLQYDYSPYGMHVRRSGSPSRLPMASSPRDGGGMFNQLWQGAMGRFWPGRGNY